MENGHRAGKWRFRSEAYGSRHYWVRNIGYVQVSYIAPRTSNNPSDRPWHLVCWGMTFNTPEEALEYAIASWGDDSEQAWNDTYARQEALMCGPGRFEQP